MIVFNKGISLAGILLLSSAFVVGPLARKFPDIFKQFLSGKRFFGIWGFGLVFAHSVISFFFLSPTSFSIFFTLNKLNLVGNFILISGILSLLLIGFAFATSFPKLLKFKSKIFFLSLNASYIGLIIGGIHVLPIGIKGGTEPNSWPGFLFPITLISFLAVLFTIYCRTVLNSIK